MAYLSPDELAQAQEDLTITMPETATVATQVRAPDGAGGTRTTWTDGATYAARKDPLGNTQTERAVASRYEGVALWTITLDGRAPAIGGDARLSIGARSFQVVADITESVPLVRTVVGQEVT